MNDLIRTGDWYAEAMLRESGERYRQLVEVAPIAIFVHCEGRIVLANPAMAKLFRAESVEQLLGREVLDLVAPASRELVRERIAQLYQTPQSVPLAEVEYVRLDGSHFSAEVTAASFRDAGRPAAQVTAHDITDRKAAERALRESEQRFRALTELSSDWFWEQDAQLRFVLTSGRTPFRGGISEFDHVGKTRWELPGTEILGQTWDDHRAVLAARASFHDVMLKRTSAEGSVFYITVSGEARYDADGNFAGYRGVAKDVTARYRIEHALRETEARLRTALDATPAAICFYDTEERILIANAGYAELIEKPAQDLPGRTLRAVIGEKAYAIAQPYIRGALAGEPTDYERRRVRSDGSARDLRVHNVAYRDESGRVIGACSMLLDVTEFKETLRRLEASEARFRALTELSSDWYWEQDENFRFVHFSSEVETAAGSSVTSHLGKTRWELPWVGVSPQRWAEHRALLEAHRPFRDFEYQRYNERGELIWMSGSGTPIFDSGGQFRGYRGIGRNITEHKRVENDLRQSSEKYEALVSSVEGIVWEADAETFAFTFVSRQAERLLGYPQRQWLEEPDFWRKHTHPDDVGWTAEFCRAATAEKRNHEFEYRMIAAEGQVVWLRDLVSLVIEDDRVVRLRGLMLDVTERKRTEHALQESERRIRLLLRRLTHTQEAERRRIAAHLHDVVGQNLSAIGMDLEALRDELQQAGVGDFAARFAPTADLLKQTLDTLRQTMADLRPPLLDDYGLLAALESHARQVTRRSGLQVAVEGTQPAARPPASVELALFRIAQEALANAIKHARASHARIVLSCGGGRLRLAVEDDGEGFFQPAGARAEQRGGWGLPLMRERAEEVGGALRIEFLRKGTRIVTDIPYVDPHHPG